MDCATTDWEARGAADGAAGADPAVLRRYRSVCERQGADVDLVAYRVGTAAGLRRYCVVQTAFALGAEGAELFRGCPEDLADVFTQAYADGRQAYEAEQVAQSLGQQIRYKRQELDAVEVDLEAAQIKVRAAGLTLAERADWLATGNGLVRQRQLLERELADLQGQLTTTQSLLVQAAQGDPAD
ncbi:MAG: DUF2799 domain-containing protein [Pseudomonadota bacterium]